MLDNLGIANNTSEWYKLVLENNEIYGTIAGYNDPVRGYYDSLQMTDEELEELAWDTFNKIPFIEGEYEYLGIMSRTTEWRNEGECVTRVGVALRRFIDGRRVINDDRCNLYFDGSGFVEMHIAMFDYKKIGTMDMVTLEEAETKIKTPDDFTIKSTPSENNRVATFQVNSINLLLVNQYSKGCTILQPLYYYSGTATLEDGTETDFSSKIIAIPEKYTYEEE